MEKPKCLEKYLEEIVLEGSLKEDKDFFLKARTMLEGLKTNQEEKVCLLKKALYGLKQARKQRYQKPDTKFKKFGFKPSEADLCIYITSKRGEKLIMAVYVDDLVIASSSDMALQNLKEKFMTCFEIRDLGYPSYCLGMKFKQTNDCISLIQRKYVEDLLKKFAYGSWTKIGKRKFRGTNKSTLPKFDRFTYVLFCSYTT